MNPYLMKVPNTLFYNKEIQSDPDQNFEFFIHEERPLIYINVNVDGNEEDYIDPSYLNLEESRTVKILLTDLIYKFKYPKEWFSIITPYKG